MILAKNIVTGEYQPLPSDIFRNDDYGVVIDHAARTFSYAAGGETLVYDLGSVYDSVRQDKPAGAEQVQLSLAFTEKIENVTYIGFVNRKTGLYKIMRITKSPETGITSFACPNGDETASFSWEERKNYNYL